MRALSILAVAALTATGAAPAGVKTFVGLGTPSTAWGVAENWQPAGVPGSADSAVIGPGQLVTISVANCNAHTVIIQNGGRLALQAADADNRLNVDRDLIVEAGGTFNTEGDPGVTGPLVYVGGDVYNAGTWNLSGVSTGNKGVVFNRLGTQAIHGPGALTFQNLANNPNDSLIVFGAHVGVMGVTSPLDFNNVTLSGGGTINIGGPPLPITLAWFEAAALKDGGVVRLSWRTLTEIDNYGFTVERSPAEGTTFTAIGFVASAGTGPVVRDYTFDDVTASAGRWLYRLRQTDLSGHETVSDIVAVTVEAATAVGEERTPPRFGLAQNYPNPFNPETVIRFAVPASGRAGITVHALTGELVATIFDGPVEGGREYAVTFSAGNLPTGLYLYRLSAGSMREVRRMLLVR